MRGLPDWRAGCAPQGTTRSSRTPRPPTPISSPRAGPSSACSSPATAASSSGRKPRFLAVRLTGKSLDEDARQLATALGLDWKHAPFTRCLIDNSVLRPANESERMNVPERSRNLPGPFTACPSCGRVFWPGGHVQRMLARLEGWETPRTENLVLNTSSPVKQSSGSAKHRPKSRYQQQHQQPGGSCRDVLPCSDRADGKS
ncbi:MAG: uncharacterized protein QOC72_822 [Methylobacteriaceae bacterium]|nr:uncharacterized protein [Methylobacteriaceae bacterium]